MSGFLNFIKNAANTVANVVSEIYNSKPVQAALERGKEIAIDIASQFVNGLVDKAAKKVADKCSVDLSKVTGLSGKNMLSGTDSLASQIVSMKKPQESGLSVSGALNSIIGSASVTPVLTAK